MVMTLLSQKRQIELPPSQVQVYDPSPVQRSLPRQEDRHLSTACVELFDTG